VSERPVETIHLCSHDPSSLVCDRERPRRAHGLTERTAAAACKFEHLGVSGEITGCPPGRVFRWRAYLDIFSEGTAPVGATGGRVRGGTLGAARSCSGCARAALPFCEGGSPRGGRLVKTPRRWLFERAARRPERAAMSPQAARLPQRLPSTSFPSPALTLRAFLARQTSRREAFFASLRPFGCGAIRPCLEIAVRPRSARPRAKEPRHERRSPLAAPRYARFRP
jgi:hypothetical protein